MARQSHGIRRAPGAEHSTKKYNRRQRKRHGVKREAQGRFLAHSLSDSVVDYEGQISNSANTLMCSSDDSVSIGADASTSPAPVKVPKETYLHKNQQQSLNIEDMILKVDGSLVHNSPTKVFRMDKERGDDPFIDLEAARSSKSVRWMEQTSPDAASKPIVKADKTSETIWRRDIAEKHNIDEELCIQFTPSEDTDDYSPRANDPEMGFFPEKENGAITFSRKMLGKLKGDIWSRDRARSVWLRFMVILLVVSCFTGHLSQLLNHWQVPAKVFGLVKPDDTARSIHRHTADKRVGPLGPLGPLDTYQSTEFLDVRQNFVGVWLKKKKDQPCIMAGADAYE